MKSGEKVNSINKNLQNKKMDRVIEKKFWNSKRIMIIGGTVALVALLTASVYFSSGKSKLNVVTDRITVSEVKKGPFQENIPVDGVVLPVTTIYLDAIEGGRVEEKFVEDGAILKKDQPILRLSNTDLELSLANQETAVFDVLTQMQNTKNVAEQNSMNRQTQMADVDNALKEAERVYNVNKKLYGQKVIGKQEYESSLNLYNYQVGRRKLSEDILKQDGSSMKLQVAQAKESYERMQNTLALMRKKVGDLIVRAPVDGQLTSLDAEVGQNKNKGERLGQLDVMSGFKARVNVDEHYSSRIFIGLGGTYTPSNGRKYKLTIKKIYTQVTAGRIQVDMEFNDSIPTGLRRGQTLQIVLALSDERNALLVNKGGFYQQTGGNWIFKVNENGTMAYKVDIQLGSQNPDYYEVLSGLQPGDKVITSSYENYGNIQELVLKAP
ncbi:MAG: HlyD family efflux transporter periplasmic adaptor subunit [Ferruginibacter sp.]